MKVVGLISGGKDSLFNLMECQRYGHEIVALANLHPDEHDESHQDELDSFMFQTVGYSTIPLVAQACQLPLYRHKTLGKSLVSTLEYGTSLNPLDEVEDLYQLLAKVQSGCPEVEAVSCGAILSNYQRIRVENVCSRLGLVCLCYLWQRDQRELLDSMISTKLDAVLIKTATMGLEPRIHLGKHLHEMRDYLYTLSDQYQVNPCGEGGEYESFVVDCPLYKQRIQIDEFVLLGDDLNSPISPSGHLRITKAQLVDKRTPIDSEIVKVFPESSETTLPFYQSSKNGFTQFCGSVDGYKNISDFISNVSESKLNLRHSFAVSLNIPDMNQFQPINKVYIQHFKELDHSPIRACVQVPSNSFCGDILMYDPNSVQTPLNMSYLHVQSISEWAPACVGPYSQACSIGGMIFLSGVIGLDPPTMKFLPEDIASPSKQLEKCMNHINSILSCMKSNKDYICAGIVFFQDEQEIEEFGIEMLKYNIPLLYVGVPCLPKQSLVEVQVYATESQLFDSRTETQDSLHGVLRSNTSHSGMYKHILLGQENANQPFEDSIQYLVENCQVDDIVFIRVYYCIRMFPHGFPNHFQLALSRFGLTCSFTPCSTLSIEKSLAWALHLYQLHFE